MYTIIMGQDKSLIKTTIEPIFQREKLANKFRFLIPLHYDGLDLSEFIVLLRYRDQIGVDHSEMLVKSDELYRETRLCYYLPIDTNLTKMPGEITIQLSITKVDEETLDQYVIHTGSTTIEIRSTEFSPDSGLDLVDQFAGILNAKLNEVKEIATIYAHDKINGLVLDEDDSIRLAVNGVGTGIGVKVVVPTIDDKDIDGVGDGIIDLSHASLPEDGNGDDLWFIDLSR